MTTLETSHTDPIVTIEQLQAYGPSAFEQANIDLTRLIEQYPEAAIFAEHDLTNAMDALGISQHHQLLKDIFNLSPESTGATPLEQHSYVPPREHFHEIVAHSYMGADGKERNTLPKFVPTHMSAPLESLMKASSEAIKSLQAPGDPARPGLTVDSGYRSPWYQTMVITRMIDKYGLPDAFKYVALAKESQHSNAEEPAVDFMIIGDRNGQRAVDPATGLYDEISSFEQSIEFDYLLENAPNQGFWLPYHPNPSDPMSNMSKTGIVFEPWHWQYVGDSAKDLMEQNKVYHSVMVRKQSRNN